MRHEQASSYPRSSLRDWKRDNPYHQATSPVATTAMPPKSVFWQASETSTVCLLKDVNRYYAPSATCDLGVSLLVRWTMARLFETEFQEVRIEDMLCSQRVYMLKPPWQFPFTFASISFRSTSNILYAIA